MRALLLAALGALYMIAASYHHAAADGEPTCIIQFGDAMIAHYGPKAAAVCGANPTGDQIAYGRQTDPSWYLECVILNTPDPVTSFAFGHGVVVFDLSLTGQSTATAVCDYAVSQNLTVLDHDWKPYIVTI